MNEYRSSEYWADRLNPETDERVKRAIMRVYDAYPSDCLPKGICDPMYMMNVICHELGIGDGKGNFTLPDSTS